MAAPVPVARISAVQGQVSAKSADGSVRPLHVGDYLYEGEVIVTGADSFVDLTALNGQPLTLGANGTLTMDAEVLGQIAPDGTDSAVQVSGDDFERIVTALNEGGSLDELLEETAAGASGGDAGGGPTFVRLLRISESVDPLSYEFATERGDVQDYPINGGAGDDDAAIDGMIDDTVDDVNTVPTLAVLDVNGSAANGTHSVLENEVQGGSFTISAPDGLDTDAALTINGTPIGKDALEASGTTPIVIDTDKGTLTIDGYDPSTGEVSWHYDPAGESQDHSGGEVLDTIPIVVKDADGDVQSGNLVINITDTEPEAKPDSNAVTEDTNLTASGNVLTAGPGADTLGADTPTQVTGVAAGTQASASGDVGVTVTGEYGTLVLNPDGSYTYTLDNASAAVQALGEGDTLSDVFTYTITDADGDTSTTTLTITVNGTNDLPELTAPYARREDENGNPVTTEPQVAENAVLDVDGTSGDFRISSPDGFDADAALTFYKGVPGTGPGTEQTFTRDQLLGAKPEDPGTWLHVQTNEGDLFIKGYDPDTGNVSWRYDPAGESKEHHGDLFDMIPIVVKDADGDETNPVNMQILVADTEPDPHDDSISLISGEKEVNGNLLLNDDLGGDHTEVILIEAMSGPGEGGPDPDQPIAGQYGSLVFDAEGNYIYTLSNGVTGSDLTDTFVYYVKDDDGGIHEAQLTIHINPTASNTLNWDGNDVNGGPGLDTLVLVDDMNLDFSGIKDGTSQRLHNIERLDLTDGNHEVKALSVQDVIDITDGHNTLIILGDSGDKVSLENGEGGSWKPSGEKMIDNLAFDVYTGADDAVRLLIQQGIAQPPPET
jgi:VCBS repeat-containing protein